MKLKSYFAASVEAAIEQARLELGGDAMLIYSRASPSDTRHLGAYEVVFALPQSALVNQANHSDSRVAAPSMSLAPAVPWERITQELAGLRRQIEAAGRAMSIAASHAGHMDEVADSLVEADITPALAAKVSAGVEKLRGSRPNADLLALAREEMASMFSANANFNNRAVALIGPPGAGKTTTLVKLAVRYGLAARRPVQIISVDNFRVAGADHLRHLASILGLGFVAVETVNVLAQSIDHGRQKDLILVDTPGYGPRDIDCGMDLAAFLASRADIDVHLVLTASMKTVDLMRMVDRFHHFRPARLLFTKLDETSRPGAVWSISADTGLPVSFITAGQQIPEDLEPASAESILTRILPSGKLREAASAEAAWAG